MPSISASPQDPTQKFVMASPHLSSDSAGVDVGRRLVLGAALAAGLSACDWTSIEEASGDSESRPSSVSTFDLEWIDATRDRRVPARLHWPGHTVAKSPAPLLVFSHGIGGTRKGYSYLGQHLAAQGWACLHVQHIGSDAAIWHGNPFRILTRLQVAAQEDEALHRVNDLSFALDRMLAEDAPPGRNVDHRRIVVGGHSYGANTAMLSIGASVKRGGQLIALRDPRFTAAVLISAPPFYGERDLAAVLGPVQIPTLHITTTEDVIRIPGLYSPVADRLDIFEATGGRLKQLVVFNGGSHSVFTDWGGNRGHALQLKTSAKLLAHAFLREVCDADGGEIADWRLHWNTLVARASGPFISI